jgi:uncharacterized membrane protein
MGEVIDGATQHAPQPGRQFMRRMLSRPSPNAHGSIRHAEDNENHSRIATPKENTMAKSAAFGVLHVVIAFSVGYALTGSFVVAGAITLVEPVANTVAHYFFDRWWTRREARRAGIAAPALAGRESPAAMPA